MDKFKLVSDYKPTGDQPQAIAQLVEGLNKNYAGQSLLGVTGSGKTFTMANVIAQVNRPTLVLAHNKTLAAQLCTEFREFFPENAVEYFVSYYDYYQPEAYIPSTDTYIEKDSDINDEIDRLRHSATAALSERRDVIIVASVSCIYSLGDPIDYRTSVISIRPGMKMPRNDLLAKLVELQYERNDLNFVRNKFRVKGDIVEIHPAYHEETAWRVEFFGDEIERISEITPLTGQRLRDISHVAIFPASHYIVSPDKLQAGLASLREEMDLRVREFTAEGKLIEAQRIAQRTNYDMEMLTEVGTCKGIENYSRVLSGREPGSIPTTLIDYFPKDWLLFVDESHVMLPQLRAMHGGDYARKKNLVDFGFRLPSAFDNRPLKFEEFWDKLNQVVYVSATPGLFERENSAQVVEQVIRPTGLTDPTVIVKPVEGQIDDLLGEINLRTERNERVLVTTLTKKMAEDLTDFLEERKVKVKYMHHEVDTFERMELLRDLRTGAIDVLVGINLLREGLDLPEVSLVAILDADKEGFLRSETSLVQTIGRAARNAEGVVIMYADTVTPSMEQAILETDRRRTIQQQYNADHGITPTTIIKEVSGVSIGISSEAPEVGKGRRLSKGEREQLITRLTREMKEAAKMLEFEHAAFLRDRIEKIRRGDPVTNEPVKKKDPWRGRTKGHNAKKLEDEGGAPPAAFNQ
ncbi:excinuclease ABC subunit UvrB [Ruminococcaceae bacterium OttesenSCG-928-D13]|nr:excinuclease ABC subunit UvrB [Ruminococcaceae bacterium OttesenSCG-928-D13]